jgi:hypothetical protein
MVAAGHFICTLKGDSAIIGTQFYFQINRRRKKRREEKGGK